MTHTICPDCGETMSSSDSGEPECIPGWYCDNCQTFWSDDDLHEEYAQDDENASEAPENQRPVPNDL